MWLWIVLEATLPLVLNTTGSLWGLLQRRRLPVQKPGGICAVRCGAEPCGHRQPPHREPFTRLIEPERLPQGHRRPGTGHFLYVGVCGGETCANQNWADRARWIWTCGALQSSEFGLKAEFYLIKTSGTFAPGPRIVCPELLALLPSLSEWFLLFFFRISLPQVSQMFSSGLGFFCSRLFRSAIFCARLLDLLPPSLVSFIFSSMRFLMIFGYFTPGFGIFYSALWWFVLDVWIFFIFLPLVLQSDLLPDGLWVLGSQAMPSFTPFFPPGFSFQDFCSFSPRLQHILPHTFAYPTLDLPALNFYMDFLFQVSGNYSPQLWDLLA